jgi:type II secretory pathway pseudopilin PulG
MSSNTSDTHSAFTLIEILVIIGITGLLLAMIIAQGKASKDRGIAAKTIEQFQVIETGLRDHFGNQEYFTGEDELGLGSNPSIVTLMQNGVLDDFFHTAPASVLETLGAYKYDNDRTTGDDDFYTESGCVLNADDEKGVNILLGGLFTTSPEAAEQIDLLIDRGDGFGCGKIKRNGPTGEYLIYHLSDRYDRVE